MESCFVPAGPIYIQVIIHNRDVSGFSVFSYFVVFCASYFSVFADFDYIYASSRVAYLTVFG